MLKAGQGHGETHHLKHVGTEKAETESQGRTLRKLVWNNRPFHKHWASLEEYEKPVRYCLHMRVGIQ